MRRLFLLALLLWLVTGCAGVRPLTNPMGPPVPIYCDNPLLLPIRDPHFLWEGIADVVDDYFRIEREEPVKVVGDTLTEGRLDTYPQVGSTLLEPWRHDSADQYEKVESMLQSIRRRAQVRVTPSEGGFLVEVAVYKELEDVKRPAHTTAGAATFRTEGSLTRVVSPIGEQEVNKGWIALGRDRALEQRMLAQLQERLGVQGRSPMPPAIPATEPAASPSLPETTPIQPSAPAAPSNCRLGARNPSDAPQERTAFRLLVQETGVEPSERRFDFSDGAPAGTPYLPADTSIPPVGSEADDLGLNAPLGPQFSPDSEVLPPFGPEEGRDSEPFGVRWRRTYRPEFSRLLDDVKGDYCQFYSLHGLALTAVGIGAAAALANTSMDEHFRHWHDGHVFTHDVSRFAYVMREFGNGWYMLPLFALCTLAQPEYEPGSANWMVAEWGRRSLRSLLVGAPVVGGLQLILGGTRPEDNLPDGSHWRFFGSSGHAVSGHAFIGGIAFLNAAEMTDNVPLKSALYAASVLPGWSRVIQDKHYLSQAILGWWLAYLSTRAVDLTDQSHQSKVILAPVAMENGGLGIGLLGAW